MTVRVLYGEVGGCALRSFLRAHGVTALLFLMIFMQVPALAQQSSAVQHTNAVTDVKTVHVGDGLKEDWLELQVPAANRPNVDTESLGEDQHPEFSRELVRAEWRTNDGVDLWIVKPAGVKRPPVVLYLYSFPSDTHRYQDMEFCKFLASKGVAAVGFVSALTGERYHDRPMKEWFISNLPEAVGASVHDVQIILDYLGKRGDFDMTRVGMFGDGSGASIAIMAAAVDPRIKVLDLINPWGDWPEWLAGSTLVPNDERPNYLKPEFLKNVDGLDPVHWLPQLKKQPVRLTYIKDGLTVTPPKCREEMESAAPANVKIVEYKDAKEFIQMVSEKGTALDWIKDQLTSNGATQEANSAKAAGTKAVTN